MRITIVKNGNVFNIRKESVTSDFALSRYTHIDAMNRPRKDPRIIRSRDEAVETIKDYIGMKRLNIFDGRFDNNKLEQAVENVDPDNAIILIDAVYRVKVSGKDKVEREEELVMWVKDLSNNFLVPVVSVKEMKKSELIELAMEKGVTVMQCAADSWLCYVSLDGKNVKHVKETAKLSTLIKFLSDNNIKINN